MFFFLPRSALLSLLSSASWPLIQQTYVVLISTSCSCLALVWGGLFVGLFVFFLDEISIWSQKTGSLFHPLGSSAGRPVDLKPRLSAPLQHLRQRSALYSQHFSPHWTERTFCISLSRMLEWDPFDFSGQQGMWMGSWQECFPLTRCAQSPI